MTEEKKSMQPQAGEICDERVNNVLEEEPILLQEEVTGSVKFFNRIRGWGFVTQDSELSVDAFVNYKWIISKAKFKSLADKDWVIFDLYEAKIDGEKKLQARNVRKIEDTLLD